MDRETVIRLWRELPGGDIVTGSALQRFAEKVEAAERERAETLWRALEIIGVGDAAHPVKTAREALMAYGHWEQQERA